MKNPKHQDKQLRKLELKEVFQRRRLDQALNAKQFAFAAGISYSAARYWFRQPGFPVFCGVVFWQDFVQWRHARAGLTSFTENALRNPPAEPEPKPGPPSSLLKDLPPRARRILEFG